MLQIAALNADLLILVAEISRERDLSAYLQANVDAAAATAKSANRVFTIHCAVAALAKYHLQAGTPERWSNLNAAFRFRTGKSKGADLGGAGPVPGMPDNEIMG